MSEEDAPERGAGPEIQVNTPQTPVRHASEPPRKSVVTRLWDVLQPLARLWGLITAVGKSTELDISIYI